jgi:hypothetical protein
VSTPASRECSPESTSSTVSNGSMHGSLKCRATTRHSLVAVPDNAPHVLDNTPRRSNTALSAEEKDIVVVPSVQPTNIFVAVFTRGAIAVLSRPFTVHPIHANSTQQDRTQLFISNLCHFFLYAYVVSLAANWVFGNRAAPPDMTDMFKTINMILEHGKL